MAGPAILLRHALRLCCIATLLSLALPSRAQWRWIGPNTAEIAAIAVCRGTVIVGTPAGIYQSRDTGNTWTPCWNGLDSAYQIFALASSGDTAYAVTGSGNLFTARVPMLKWTRVPTPVPIAPSRGVFVAVHDSAIVLAGQYGASQLGLLISTNGGLSWKETGDSSAAGATTSCYAATPDPASGELVVFRSSSSTHSGEDGIFVSRDTGRSWSRTNPMPAALLYANRRKIFAVFPDKGGNFDAFGLFATTDLGATWHRSDNGIAYRNGIYAMSALGDTVFAEACGDGMYRSTDNGNWWSRWDSGLFDCRIVVMDTIGSVLLGGASYPPPATQPTCSTVRLRVGFYASTDHGATWHQRNRGLGNAGVHEIAAIDSTVAVACRFAGEFESSDHGARWIAPREPSSNMWTDDVWGVSAERGSREIFADFRNYDLYSTDVHDTAKCATWSHALDDTLWHCSQNGIPSGTAPFSMMVDSLSDPTTFSLYLSDDKGGNVWRSTNGGRDWYRPDTAANLPATLDMALLPPAHAGGPAELVAATTGGVYRSRDQGTTWVKDAVLGTTRGTPYLVCAMGATLYVLTDQTIYVSVNRGYYRELAPPVGRVYRLRVAADRLWAVGSSGSSAAYWRHGPDDTWHPVSIGLPFFVGVNAVAASASTVYLGTEGYGVWELPIAQLDTAAAVREAAAPGDDALRIYPSPVSATMDDNLVIEIPGDRHVPAALRISTIIGQDVPQRLFDGGSTAGDGARMSIRVGALPEGMYVVRVSRAGRAWSGRFVVVR